MAAVASRIGRFISGTFLIYLWKLALGLGLVVAEGVGQEFRMQEALLRRHRHERAGAGDQDWLAELVVPAAEGEPLALEAGDGEGVGQDVVAKVGTSVLPDRVTASPIARTASQAE